MDRYEGRAATEQFAVFAAEMITGHKSSEIHGRSIAQQWKIYFSTMPTERKNRSLQLHRSFQYAKKVWCDQTPARNTGHYHTSTWLYWWYWFFPGSVRWFWTQDSKKPWTEKTWRTTLKVILILVQHLAVTFGTFCYFYVDRLVYKSK